MCDLPARLLAEPFEDRPLHPAIATGIPREHDERELACVGAEIPAANRFLLGTHRRARVADDRVGGLGIELRVLEPGDLHHACERTCLAPRGVLPPPELRARVAGEHVRGLVALLLDQLADYGRRPLRPIRPRR